MTSETRLDEHRDSRLEMRSTGSQLFVPTAALWITVLATQHAAAVLAMPSGTEQPSSTLTVSAMARDTGDTVFKALIDFHEQLASSQQDLPEEAARILRENLWQLYE